MLVLVLGVLLGDQAREVRLIVGALASELVEGEGCRNGGERDVEAGLDYSVSWTASKVVHGVCRRVRTHSERLAGRAMPVAVALAS